VNISIKKIREKREEEGQKGVPKTENKHVLDFRGEENLEKKQRREGNLIFLLTFGKRKGLQKTARGKVAKEKERENHLLLETIPGGRRGVRKRGGGGTVEKRRRSNSPWTGNGCESRSEAERKKKQVSKTVLGGGKRRGYQTKRGK